MKPHHLNANNSWGNLAFRTFVFFQIGAAMVVAYIHFSKDHATPLSTSEWVMFVGVAIYVLGYVALGLRKSTLRDKRSIEGNCIPDSVLGANDKCRQMEEEIWALKEKLGKLESDRAGWKGFFFLLGIPVLLVIWCWATNPSKYWEVDTSADRPEIIFNYRFWSDDRQTRYTWGKNDGGELTWISVDAKGLPDGGSLPKGDD